MNKLTRGAVLAALCVPLAAANAQSSCSSDGVAPPAALVERFINADCEACWSDPAVVVPGPGELVLDWIVPGTRGEDAPLSAAARLEGEARLQALGLRSPARAGLARHRATSPQRRLRVAHGLAFNGYIGASIELKPGGKGPWHAWLALVETIPARVEGTPVVRNLVRNVVEADWRGSQPSWLESRAMNIPEGATPERLRVVGWVEDARGRIRAIAESRCVPPGGQG